jgi:hypothetical protein
MPRRVAHHAVCFTPKAAADNLFSFIVKWSVVASMAPILLATNCGMAVPCIGYQPNSPIDKLDVLAVSNRP